MNGDQHTYTYDQAMDLVMEVLTGEHNRLAPVRPEGPVAPPSEVDDGMDLPCMLADAHNALRRHARPGTTERWVLTTDLPLPPRLARMRASVCDLLVASMNGELS